MSRGKQLAIALYVLLDHLAATIAWAGLFTYRKLYLQYSTLEDVLSDPNLYLGIGLIPIFWLAIYFLIGTYTDIFRKSRLTELYVTFLTSLVGVLILFFALIIDDITSNVSYQGYYSSLGVLFGLHFGLTIFFRLSFLTLTKRLVKKGKVGFNTLIVGSNGKALSIYKELSERAYLGHRFSGFITLDKNTESTLTKQLKTLGQLTDLESVIEKEQVEEVVIALETEEHQQINKVINQLAGQNVVIKIIPGMYDILAGSVKMGNVIGAALIEIQPRLMPFWQKVVKRAFDIVASFLALLLLSPVLLYVTFMVRISSKGPIFFYQERVGLRGKPFKIIKFRSMYVNAEKDGPMLSRKGDPRITPWGRIIRKWRLDELPQFWNVMVGDMSLVGPRPERQHYIDKIAELAPEYKHLQKVQPGLTSMGMVKYGYAQNVDQMIERMKYDLIYIENMGLSMDLKVMIYTVLIILQGKGK